MLPFKLISAGSPGQLLEGNMSHTAEVIRPLSMLDVINQGASKISALPRPCPFCGCEPPLAEKLAGKFVVGCENDDCAAQPSVRSASLEEAWAMWNGRAA